MLVVEIDSGGVLQFVYLLFDFGGDSRVAMAHTGGRDSSK